jgi:hypothetical protein
VGVFDAPFFQIRAGAAVAVVKRQAIKNTIRDFIVLQLFLFDFSVQ